MNKKSKIIIVILSILVIGLVAYIVVDKVLENNNVKNNETVNTAGESNDNNAIDNNNVEDINVVSNTTNSAESKNQNNSSATNSTTESNTLSEDEAYMIADKLYERASNCYWGLMEYDANMEKIGENYYFKITNIDEIKDVLIDDAFDEFIKYMDIVVQGGEYYYPNVGPAADDTYIGHELTEIEFKSNNEISFVSIEKYMKDEDFGKSVNEIKDFDIKKFVFKMKKIDGKWKVSEYTDSSWN